MAPRPSLVGTTQAKSLGGSVSLPYPPRCRQGDLCVVVGSVGPNLVADGDDFYGPMPRGVFGEILVPDGGSAYPYDLFMVPGGDVAVSCSWPDLTVIPISYVAPFQNEWENPWGVNKAVAVRTHTGVLGENPPFTLSSAPAVPVHLYMVVVRDAELSAVTVLSGDPLTPHTYPTGFSAVARPGFFALFNFVGDVTDPGGTGHAGDYPVAADLSVEFDGIGAGGGFTLATVFSTAVLYVTAQGSPFPRPAFAAVDWETPTFNPASPPDPVSAWHPFSEIAADPEGNKAWMTQADGPVYGSPGYSGTVIWGALTHVNVRDDPERTDRYWTYSGHALFKYIVDQSYHVASYVLSFQPPPLAGGQGLGFIHGGPSVRGPSEMRVTQEGQPRSIRVATTRDVTAVARAEGVERAVATRGPSQLRIRRKEST